MPVVTIGNTLVDSTLDHVLQTRVRHALLVITDARLLQIQLGDDVTVNELVSINVRREKKMNEGNISRNHWKNHVPFQLHTGPIDEVVSEVFDVLFLFFTVGSGEAREVA